MPFTLKYYALDEKGNSVLKEIPATVEIYKHAASNGMSLRQYAKCLAPDYDPSKGEPLDQMYAQSGLLDGQKYGMPAPTLAEIVNSKLASDFRRPDGSDTSLGARLLYPQLILETLQMHALRDDGGDIVSIWESLIAVNRSLDGNKADQPIIDVTEPEKSRSGRITQLAEPETMISITTGDKSYRIPTYSIGLLISDEAMKATTIDLVRVVMEAQARGERVARAMEQLKAMVLGDVDLGINPLPVTKIGTFDSTITQDGVITKRAYLKWLHSKQKVCNLSTVLTDIDTAITVDECLLPKVTGSDASKIATSWGGMNLGLTQPRLVPVEADVFSSGLLVGLDPRYAIQRFVNVSAAYEAIEEYVMRKATAFRVDFGEMSTRLYDEAWSVVSLEKA